MDKKLDRMVPALQRIMRKALIKPTLCLTAESEILLHGLFLEHRIIRYYPTFTSIIYHMLPSCNIFLC